MNSVKLSYRVAIIMYLLQIVILTITTFDRDIALDDIKNLAYGSIIVAFKAIPWLILLPGLIMRSEKIMAWMCYVCLVYFVLWVLAAFSVGNTSVALMAILVTVIQFMAAAINTRLAKRQ